MPTHVAIRNIKLVLLIAVFGTFASQAYAGATPHMAPLRSGLVSLSSQQTIRLNVTLNPDLVAATQGVPLTLTFDIYPAPLAADDTSASVARIAEHRSVQVTLNAGQAAFFDYTVGRDSTGELVAASVGISNPDLRTLLPAIMPTLEGRSATGQTIFVLPGAPCAFLQVENLPSPVR